MSALGRKRTFAHAIGESHLPDTERGTKHLELSSRRPQPHRSSTHLYEVRRHFDRSALLSGQQRLEIRKRRMSCTTAIFASVGTPGRRFQLTLMFVVVAVQAEQFPVAAVGRVVVVIVIAVMNRQLTQVGARKLAATAAADPRINLEGLLPIGLRAFFCVAASLS